MWKIWQPKWKNKKEETSSSMSGLQFGHYNTGGNSDFITIFMHRKPCWPYIMRWLWQDGPRAYALWIIFHHDRKSPNGKSPTENHRRKYWHNAVFYHVWITSDFLVDHMYLMPTHRALAILGKSTFYVGIVGTYDCMISYCGIGVFLQWYEFLSFFIIPIVDSGCLWLFSYCNWVFPIVV